MFTIFALIALVALLPGCSQNAQTGERNSMEGRPVVSAADPSVVVTPTPDPRGTESIRIACEGQELDLENFENTERNRTEIRLVQRDGKVVHAVEMPKVNDFQNFAVGHLAARKDGFQFNVDWGTRISHEIEFDFVCRRGEFYLTGLVHQTFDRRDPENAAKYTKRNISMAPSVPFKKVVVADLLWELYENPKWSGKISEMKRSK